MPDNKVSINRAPVLTLWASVVAERLGYDGDESRSLGKAVAGLNAQAKGRSLGIFGRPADRTGGDTHAHAPDEEFWVELCGRPVPAKRTENGVRAVIGDRAIEPAAVRKYLTTKFGIDLERVQAALSALAEAYEPDELEQAAFALYEEFRPTVATGKRGWGQKGDLNLNLIGSLADKEKKAR